MSDAICGWRILWNAVGGSDEFIALANGFSKIGVGEKTLQSLCIFLSRHILEVEGVDGRGVSDLRLTLRHILLLLFLVFCSHCFLLLFIAKH